MTTLRISLGDFAAIDHSVTIEDNTRNILFWILFSLTVLITAIIFLNFIVAEASASYEKVIQTL